MNIAIVGSRDLTNYEWFLDNVNKVLEKWEVEIKDVTIVSGGARGTDTLAEKFAKENGLECKVFKPNWRPNGVYDPGAGIKRNTDIISASDKVIAFPSKNGRGTQDSIRKAMNLKKECEVIFIKTQFL